MSDILVLLAHPQLQRSRVNLTMLRAIQDLAQVKIHDLYELYPDFHIDKAHEKEALIQAHTIVLQHPIQWYSCPSLLKEWLDVVLQKGWAYGEGGRALVGKRLLNAVSTGGPPEAYQAGGSNRFTIDEFLYPFNQTAHLCGIDYLAPLVFHNALKAESHEIDQHAQHYRKKLLDFASSSSLAGPCNE